VNCANSEFGIPYAHFQSLYVRGVNVLLLFDDPEGADFLILIFDADEINSWTPFDVDWGVFKGGIALR